MTTRLCDATGTALPVVVKPASVSAVVKYSMQYMYNNNYVLFQTQKVNKENENLNK